MAGILSIVGTPIGNLSDASPRVLDTLAAANTVLCEDTRVTSKLLARFEIHTSLERCDENVIASRIPAVLERLRAGERIAFVSDAGMPGISDPGQRLVDAALDEGLAVEVVPGPSALTCALVASGIACDHFFFEGFLPRKPTSRTSRLSELAWVPGALIFYESPRRVAATLAAIAEVMPARQVALVREITKIHEEVVRASAPTLAAQIAEREEIRGECVVVVASRKKQTRRQPSLASLRWKTSITALVCPRTSPSLVSLRPKIRSKRWLRVVLRPAVVRLVRPKSSRSRIWLQFIALQTENRGSQKRGSTSARWRTYPPTGALLF